MGEWLTKDELLARLPSWSAENLQAEEQGEQAIASAETYVKALLQNRNRYPPKSIHIPVLKEAVYNLALFYLYARIEQEEKARDKKEMALQILDALFEGEAETLAPGGSVYVRKGEEDWHGFC
jgi:phage gp36-like protein